MPAKPNDFIDSSWRVKFSRGFNEVENTWSALLTKVQRPPGFNSVIGFISTSSTIRSIPRFADDYVEVDLVID